MAKVSYFSSRRGRILKENLTAYIFIAPAAVIIAAFGLFPVLSTVYISLHRWRIRRTRFIGLANLRDALGNPIYLLVVVLGILLIGAAWFAVRKMPRKGKAKWARAFTVALLALSGVAALAVGLPYMASSGDEAMFDSLRVTVWYSVVTVPCQLALGLVVAYLLFQRVPGKQGLRVTYLLPYVVPSVASAAVFEILFSLRPESFVNQIIGLFGIPAQQWLQEPKGIFQIIAGAFSKGIQTGGGVISKYWSAWAQGPSLALVSIMIYNIWVFVGYYALIYLAGLGNISRELYEAAEVDGANRWQSFIRITVPLLSPSTFFLTLLGVIGTFNAFNHIYVLRSSSARGVVDTMSIYIFFTFFRNASFGYAAAMALILFAITLSLTIIQRRMLEGKVFYG
jgi:multiple sugar transport system permease protein